MSMALTDDELLNVAAGKPPTGAAPPADQHPLVAAAQQHVGEACGPNGCARFVSRALKTAGYHFGSPSSSALLQKMMDAGGERVDQPQPGDVYFYTGGKTGYSHVGIEGANQIIDAPGSSAGYRSIVRPGGPRAPAVYVRLPAPSQERVPTRGNAPGKYAGDVDALLKDLTRNGPGPTALSDEDLLRVAGGQTPTAAAPPSVAPAAAPSGPKPLSDAELLRVASGSPPAAAPLPSGPFPEHGAPPPGYHFTVPPGQVVGRLLQHPLTPSPDEQQFGSLNGQLTQIQAQQAKLQAILKNSGLGQAHRTAQQSLDALTVQQQQVQAQQKALLAKLAQNHPDTLKTYADEANRLEAERKRLDQAQRQPLTPDKAVALKQQIDQHTAAVQALGTRAQQINAVTHQLNGAIQSEAKAYPGKIHGGTLYPGEKEIGGGTPGSPAQKIADVATGLLTPASVDAQQARQHLIQEAMQRGTYPPLPPLSGTPAQQQQQIAEKNDLLHQLTTKPGFGVFEGLAHQNAPRQLSPEELKALTPWQRKLLPVVTQQLQAEDAATKKAPILAAALSDTGASLAGMAVGNIVSGKVFAALSKSGRYLRWLAPAAEQGGSVAVRELSHEGVPILARQTIPQLSQAALKRLVVQPLPTVLAGAAGGGAGSFAAGTTAGLIQGKGVPAAVQQGASYVPSGVLVGGVLGAFHHFAGVAVQQLQSGDGPDAQAAIQEMVSRGKAAGISDADLKTLSDQMRRTVKANGTRNEPVEQAKLNNLLAKYPGSSEGAAARRFQGVDVEGGKPIPPPSKKPTAETRGRFGKIDTGAGTPVAPAPAGPAPFLEIGEGTPPAPARVTPPPEPGPASQTATLPTPEPPLVPAGEGPLRLLQPQETVAKPPVAAPGTTAQKLSPAPVVPTVAPPSDAFRVPKPTGDRRADFLRSEIEVPTNDPRPGEVRDVGYGVKQKFVPTQHLGDQLPPGRDTLYHETSTPNAKGLIQLLNSNTLRSTNLQATDNLDLALGQGGKGVVLELDPTKVNGGPARVQAGKAAAAALGQGGEYVVTRAVPDPVKAIIAGNQRSLDALKNDPLTAKLFDFGNVQQVERGFRVARKGTASASVAPQAPPPSSKPVPPAIAPPTPAANASDANAGVSSGALPTIPPGFEELTQHTLAGPNLQERADSLATNAAKRGHIARIEPQPDKSLRVTVYAKPPTASVPEPPAPSATPPAANPVQRLLAEGQAKHAHLQPGDRVTWEDAKLGRVAGPIAEVHADGVTVGLPEGGQRRVSFTSRTLKRSEPAAKPSEAVARPSEPVKQPWEMTRAEWDADWEKTKADWTGSQSPSSAGMGATKSAKGAQERFDAIRARQEHLKMGLKDAKPHGDEGLTIPPRHKQVVEEALRQGKDVPERVRAEYPELKAPEAVAEAAPETDKTTAEAAVPPAEVKAEAPVEHPAEAVAEKAAPKPTTKPTSKAKGAPGPTAPIVGAPEIKGGAPTTLKDLFRGAQDRLREKLYAARNQNLDLAKGTFESRFIKNFGYLKRVAPGSLAAAQRAAGSQAQSAVIMRRGMEAVEQIMGSSGQLELFKAAKVEDRLRAIRESWLDFAAAALNTPDADFTGDTGSSILSTLGALSGKRGFEGVDVRAGAETLLAAGQIKVLRNYVHDAFTKAAQEVGTIFIPGGYDKLVQSPKFQAANQVFRQVVESPLAEAHAANEGIFSDRIGPLGYYPLVALDEKLQPVKKGPGGRATPFRAPKNPNNQFATGLAAAYDLSTEALAKHVSTAIRTNNKALLINSLAESGVIRKLKPNEPDPQTMIVAGHEVPAHVEMVGPGRTLLKDGKVIHLPTPRVAMPKQIHKELEPILAGRTDGDSSRLMGAINAIGMGAPMMATIHSYNLLGALVTGTPFAGTDLLSKTLGNTPATKVFTAIVNVIRTNPGTPAAIREIEEMAAMGAVPDRYAAETYSPAFARRTGAHFKPVSLGPFLMGPAGVDIRARLLMYRISKQINPNATPAQHSEFIGQMGNYVRGMQGSVERWMKSTAFAPFYTAATAMNINGVRAWLGTGPLPVDPGARKAALKFAQLLSGGAIAAVAFWILLHKLYRGKLPWEDPDSKFNSLQLTAKDRRSPAGQVIFGPGDTPAYVGLGFFNPLVDRGSRTLGVKAGYDVMRATGRPGQAAEHAEKDVLNSLLHPFTSGPAFHAAVVGASGHDPYISSLRDQSGRFGPQFYGALTRSSPGLPTAAARVQEAVLNTNQFYQDLFAMLGGGAEAQRDTTPAGAKALRMALDLAFPRLIKGTADPSVNRERLDTEYVAASRADPDAKLVDAGTRRTVDAKLQEWGLRLPTIAKHVTSVDGGPGVGNVSVAPLEIPDKVFPRYKQELTKKWYDALLPFATNAQFQAAPRKVKEDLLHDIDNKLREAEQKKVLPILLSGGAKIAVKAAEP